MLSKVLIGILMAVVLLWGCGGSSGSGGGGGGGGSVTVVVSPATFTLGPGDQKTFTAIVNGTTNGSVTWKATGGRIDKDGVYTAPTTLGTYTVTATSAADSSKTGTATVTVTSGVSVSISPATVTLVPSGTQQFAANVIGASDKTVTWTAMLGTIDSSGRYTAPATEGTDKITATSNADASAKATATVTVSKGSSGINVTVSPQVTSSGTNEKTQFNATVTGTSNTSVVWSATGGTIDSSGLYTAPPSTGTYTVTATSVADGTRKGSATITVNPVTISVSSSATEVAPGGNIQFTAVVNGAHDRSVTWTTSRGSITTDGVLTAPTTAGDVTVTATSNADPTVKGSLTVTVSLPSTYTFDFENGIPSYFTNADRAETAPNSQKYYGKFGGTESPTMTLPGLKSHQYVRITFDVYVVDDWRGVDRTDEFGCRVAGNSVLDTTFSNGYNSAKQHYPDSKGGATYVAGSNSAAQNSLGYSVSSGLAFSDTTYHISRTVAHTDTSLTVQWFSNLTDTAPFWGIDNVKVELLNSLSPSRR